MALPLAPLALALAALFGPERAPPFEPPFAAPFETPFDPPVADDPERPLPPERDEGPDRAEPRPPPAEVERDERDEPEDGGRAIDPTYRPPAGASDTRVATDSCPDATKAPEGAFVLRNPAASYSPRESTPKYHRRWWA